MSIPEVIVVNGHGLGQYTDVKVLPVVGETAKASSPRFEEDAGKGTNLAVAIAKLGGNVAFLGKAGDDEGGKLGEKWMGEAGVNLENYWLDPNISTDLGLCIIDEFGDNIILNFDDDANSIQVPELEERLPKLKGAKYIVSGFEVPVSSALRALQLGKELGMTTVLNPSPLEDPLDDLSFVDILAINATEGLFLMDQPADAEADPEAIAKMLHEKYGVPTIIITLGDKGSYASSPEGSFYVKVNPVTCVDQCGAGDGFLAATVWGLNKGDDLKTAMEFASLYASYVVAHVGTVCVYPDHAQLNEFLGRKA